MARKKNDRHISPKGVAVWPRLNEPDTKFKEEGEFTVKLAYDPDDDGFKQLVAKLEAKRDELFQEFLSENPKLKKTAKVAPVFAEEVDKEGDETGRVTLNFKMRHKCKSKKTGKTWEQRPDIFDAKGVKLETPPQIGGGSTLRVSFETTGSYVQSAKTFYLSLRMLAVKIIDLVEFGSRTADDYGFDEDEEGFEADEAHTAKPAPKFEDNSDDDGEDDVDGDDGDY